MTHADAMGDHAAPCPLMPNYGAPPVLFVRGLGRFYVIDDLVWMVRPTEGILETREEHWPTLARQAGAHLSGYDYRTGKVTRTIEVPNAMSPGHHLRCYRSKATDRFILYPKRGAEFLDLHGDDHMRHDWLRGSCRYGILPCNGLLYTPPDQCFCYIGAKMYGFTALAPVNSSQAALQPRTKRLTTLRFAHRALVRPRFPWTTIRCTIF